jgi:signal peptide peptidase SppA
MRGLGDQRVVGLRPSAPAPPASGEADATPLAGPNAPARIAVTTAVIFTIRINGLLDQNNRSPICDKAGAVSLLRNKNPSRVKLKASRHAFEFVIHLEKLSDAHYMGSMPRAAFLTTLADRLQFLLPRRFRTRQPLVSVVRLGGVIGAVLPLRPGLSITSVAPMLERAFAPPDLSAVALVVNSPGGSPAQSHLIFKRVRALAEEKKLPVLVFIEDAAASGGYMIACAGDEIFADPSSLVGSIGVVSASFGFDRLIERFGIERRVHTAGENKAMLDPFRPESPKDVERLKALQLRIHEMFVGLVRTRRGAKLKTENGDLFSGAVWVGTEAMELGLVDGLGDIRSVLRERFGEKVQMRVIPPARPSLLGRWLSRQPFGPDAILDAREAIAALEERAAWARLGL